MPRQSLLSLSLLAALALSAAALPAQSAENYLMVTMPATETSAATKQLQAKVTIDAPPSYVWQVITDYNRLDEILPGYEKSQLVSSAGRSKTVDVGMKVNPFLPRYNYQVRVTENPGAQQLNMHRISGDFKSLDASYKLVSQNGGKQTLLTYDLAVDPGNRIPGAGAILKANTEKTLKALQNYIEQAHRKSVTAKR